MVTDTRNTINRRQSRKGMWIALTVLILAVLAYTAYAVYISSTSYNVRTNTTAVSGSVNTTPPVNMPADGTGRMGNQGVADNVTP